MRLFILLVIILLLAFGAAGQAIDTSIRGDIRNHEIVAAMRLELTGIQPAVQGLADVAMAVNDQAATTSVSTDTSSTSTVPDAVGASSYSVSFGAGFSRTASSKAIGWGNFSYCKSGWCPYTTWSNITGETATVTGGLRYDLATQGPFTLFMLGELGGATTNGAVNTVLAGGGGADLALSKFSQRWQHCYLTGVIQGEHVGTQGVHPSFSLGFKYVFGK